MQDGIKSIDSTFKNCQNLRSVFIPDSVTDIDDAFYGCNNLVYIYIGSDNIKTFDRAFYGCTGIKCFDDIKIKISESINDISLNSAFYNTGIEEVVLDAENIIRLDSSFSKCKNLKRVEIKHPTLGYISGNYRNYSSSSIFSYCENLTDVTVPAIFVGNNLSNYSRGSSFLNCYKLEDIKTIDNEDVKIWILGDSRFSNCYNLKTINGQTIKICFNNTNCNSNNAPFAGCYNIRKIKAVPISPTTTSTTIGQYNIHGFRNCEEFDFTEFTHIPTLATNNFSDTTGGYKILVPASLYEGWITATNWAKIASHIIPVEGI